MHSEDRHRIERGVQRPIAIQPEDAIVSADNPAIRLQAHLQDVQNLRARLRLGNKGGIDRAIGMERTIPARFVPLTEVKFPAITTFRSS